MSMVHPVSLVSILMLGSIYVWYYGNNCHQPGDVFRYLRIENIKITKWKFCSRLSTNTYVVFFNLLKCCCCCCGCCCCFSQSVHNFTSLTHLYHKVVFLFQNKPLRKTIYFIYRRKAYIFSNHTPLSGTIKRPENMLSLSEILTYPKFSVQFSENTLYRKYPWEKIPLSEIPLRKKINTKRKSHIQKLYISLLPEKDWLLVV